MRKIGAQRTGRFSVAKLAGRRQNQNQKSVPLGSGEKRSRLQTMKMVLVPNLHYLKDFFKYYAPGPWISYLSIFLSCCLL